MKKIVFILALVLALGAGSVFVLAESTEDSRLFDWHKERMDYRREGLKDGLNNGDISQDEYNNWSEHFDYMEEFHEENGFQRGKGYGRGMGYGYGRCHGGRF